VRAAVHLAFTTDDLDGLKPPHDEPWERAMATRDSNGCKVEFAQGPLRR